MSDLHSLPLREHDLPSKPQVRAQVYASTPSHWWWHYQGQMLPILRHGPFGSWREAYNSARRMVELL